MLLGLVGLLPEWRFESFETEVFSGHPKKLESNCHVRLWLTRTHRSTPWSISALRDRDIFDQHPGLMSLPRSCDQAEASSLPPSSQVDPADRSNAFSLIPARSLKPCRLPQWAPCWRAGIGSRSFMGSYSAAARVPALWSFTTCCGLACEIFHISLFLSIPQCLCGLGPLASLFWMTTAASKRIFLLYSFSMFQPVYQHCYLPKEKNWLNYSKTWNPLVA